LSEAQQYLGDTQNLEGLPPNVPRGYRGYELVLMSIALRVGVKTLYNIIAILFGLTIHGVSCGDDDHTSFPNICIWTCNEASRSRCQATFLTSHHTRMHRVIFYIPNTLMKLII